MAQCRQTPEHCKNPQAAIQVGVRTIRLAIENYQEQYDATYLETISVGDLHEDHFYAAISVTHPDILRVAARVTLT